MVLKLFSEILGSKVLLAQEHAVGGTVLGVLISPEDGAFLGFSTNDPLTGKIRYVPAIEIRAFQPEAVVIDSYDSLAEATDLVRLKEVLNQKIKIVGATVFTKDGEKIGKVNEAALNVKTFVLDRIFVTPVYKIKYLAKDLIIPASKIEEILPKKIIVSDGYLKSKSKATVFAPLPITE